MTEGRTLTAAVVICAYTERRLPDIDLAVDSLRHQSRPAAQVIMAIDHNDALADTCEERYSDIATIVRSDQPKGLSGARNAGIAVATADVVLFLDDDAIAEETWIERMLAPMEADPTIAVVGGRTLPRWDTGRPAWFPPEFDWVVGATYQGVRLEQHDVRNPFGGNAAWRRDVFARAGGFSTGVGRNGDDAAGCEETEMAIRFHDTCPTERIVFTPDAVITHRVTTDREKFDYFVTRCANEGVSKAKIAAMVGKSATTNESAYVTSVLAPAVARYVVEAARTRDVAPLSKAGAIVAGLGATGGKFVARRGKALAGQGAAQARTRASAAATQLQEKRK